MQRFLLTAGVLLSLATAGAARADVPPPPPSGPAGSLAGSEVLRTSLVGGALALGLAAGGIWLLRRQRKEKLG